MSVLRCLFWCNVYLKHAYLFFSVPGKAPRSLLVTPLSRSAKFTWTVVHPSFQYGRQISYKIKAYNLRTEEIDFSFSYPVTDESRIDYVKWLSGLKGLTNYRLNVSLINQVGEGPIASLLFTTLEGGEEVC